MTFQAFPDDLFRSLLDKLARAVEVGQNTESTLNPRTRQALYQATIDFKDALSRAKEIADNLPGGEMLIEEQNEVIALLEQLRDSKKEQLEAFANRPVTTIGHNSAPQNKMEIDSTASSPHE